MAPKEYVHTIGGRYRSEARRINTPPIPDDEGQYWRSKSRCLLGHWISQASDGGFMNGCGAHRPRCLCFSAVPVRVIQVAVAVPQEWITSHAGRDPGTFSLSCPMLAPKNEKGIAKQCASKHPI